ncbi:hypothetical protein ETU09_08900 [Apibacter muscae]|uniref:Uncharacterized protein n=1 Tax=Apibacter muscae TaxID=2509004 RepID=A0A563D999_9FLAO|nr:hypothetical protein [Apibacter muscae]TWP26672.1 hypothetical protein ETU09_08900 [Apibacter muscae]
MKKHLIGISFFLTTLMIGQVQESSINMVDKFKVAVYQSIINSKEFKSNKSCHIVGIKPIALTMDYSIGSTLGDLFYNVKETSDTVIIKELRKKKKKKTWIFKEPDESLLGGYNLTYVSALMDSDSLYIPQNIDFEADLCKSNLDIIKIYEPLDKWMDFYKKYYSKEFKNYQVVIPVKYVSLTQGSMFPEKEKYYLFKISIGYNKKADLEIVKEIIEGIKEEREIISN